VTTADAGACIDLVNATFATNDDYPGVKRDVSAAVRSCCADLVVNARESVEAHRWNCCANLPPEPSDEAIMACTPWGPPVPPAMKRRASLLEVA
jgi:hypothetical protein